MFVKNVPAFKISIPNPGLKLFLNIEYKQY